MKNTRNAFQRYFRAMLFLALSSFAKIAATIENPPSASNDPLLAKAFISYRGMGPDKWASAWLIKRHIRPAKGVRIVAGDYEPTDEVLFDHPEGAFKRTHQLSTFESLQLHFLPDDKKLSYLAGIIDDIEVNLWRPNTRPESDIVESGFRELQRTYATSPDNIPFGCYLSFFDNVYRHLNGTSDSGATEDILFTAQTLLPNRECAGNAVGRLLDQNRFIPELSLPELFSLIKSGHKVTFVDTREPEEYQEAHIPGAINLLIREVNASTPKRLGDADLIISYCVKDFRGFEMAKTLRQFGLKNTAILNPYGIRGWIHAGLPVAGDLGMTENHALLKLNACTENLEQCTITH